MSSAAVAEPPVAIDEPLVAEPKRRAREDERTRQKRQPPYAVIIHNDEEHTFPYVIELLMKVFAHPAEKAYLLTNQVHYSGKAIVWTGSLEHAELKRDQVRGYGTDFYATKPVEFPLGVTIEPLPSD